MGTPKKNKRTRGNKKEKGNKKEIMSDITDKMPTLEQGEEKEAPTMDNVSNIHQNSVLQARYKSLEKHLQQRPTAVELKERNILLDTKVAPSIQLQQKELEKRMRADSLNEKIANRPSPVELRKNGILTDADKLYEERIEEEYAKREGGA